jgi:hypothetical protein
MSMAVTAFLSVGLAIGAGLMVLTIIDIATDGRFVTWLFGGRV